jgi:hypothetical protein
VVLAHQLIRSSRYNALFSSLKLVVIRYSVASESYYVLEPLVRRDADGNNDLRMISGISINKYSEVDMANPPK